MSDQDLPRPRGNALAARIRAALAYRDLDRAQVGAKLGVSKETVSRWMAGSSTPDLEQRLEIAALAGVPAGFLEHGFTPGEAAQGDLAADVAELRAWVEELRRAGGRPG